MGAGTVMTMSEAANRLGCQCWQIKRAVSRGFLAPLRRLGTYCLVDESQLAEIRAALVRAGYLREKKNAS